MCTCILVAYFFLDAVRTPTIIKYPNKAYYVVGEDTSIHLTCRSDGNPKPTYQWYKETHNELISISTNFTITDVNVMNRGVYICNVTNTFNGETHTSTSSERVNIIDKGKFRLRKILDVYIFVIMHNCVFFIYMI